MLSLSSEYAATTTDGERSANLAAGHAVISLSRGTGNAAGLGLVWVASLIFSIIILRSREPGKATAWIGILSFSLPVPSSLFAGYAYGSSTPLGGVLAVVTSLGGGLLSLVWYVIVGLRLLKQSSTSVSTLTFPATHPTSAYPGHYPRHWPLGASYSITAYGLVACSPPFHPSYQGDRGARGHVTGFPVPCVHFA
jgi:hypothetical protein